MTQAQINAAENNARKGSQSFTACHWDNAEKCLVYQFDSGSGAEEFKFFREMQGCTLNMVVKVNHAKLSSLREYHP
jgi:hypothetical protein